MKGRNEQQRESQIKQKYGFVFWVLCAIIVGCIGVALVLSGGQKETEESVVKIQNTKGVYDETGVLRENTFLSDEPVVTDAPNVDTDPFTGQQLVYGEEVKQDD